MIKDIANIQYFIKANVYGEFIEDKIEYIEKIKNTYIDIDENEVKENLEVIKHLAVSAIKLNTQEKIETNYITKKAMFYEEYLSKCEILELEMETELERSKELMDLTIDSLFSYINKY